MQSRDVLYFYLISEGLLVRNIQLFILHLTQVKDDSFTGVTGSFKTATPAIEFSFYLNEKSPLKVFGSYNVWNFHIAYISMFLTTNFVAIDWFFFSYIIIIFILKVFQSIPCLMAYPFKFWIHPWCGLWLHCNPLSLWYWIWKPSLYE